jgi:hypothetical protein
MVQSQPRQTVHETLSQKYPSRRRAGGVAQGEGPAFKSQYHKKKKKYCKITSLMAALKKCFTLG